MVAMGMASFSIRLNIQWLGERAWTSVAESTPGRLVAGSMNMMGNLARFVAPNVCGFITQAYNTTITVIYVMAGYVHNLGAVWPFIDPRPVSSSDCEEVPGYSLMRTGSMYTMFWKNRLAHLTPIKLNELGAVLPLRHS